MTKVFLDRLGIKDGAAGPKRRRFSFSVQIAVGLQVAADIVAVIVTGMMCWAVIIGRKNPENWLRYLAASAIIALIAAVAASFSRLYDFDVVSRSSDHLGRLTIPLVKAFLIFILLAFSVGHADLGLSRAWTYGFFVAAEVALLGERHAVSRLIFTLGQQGKMTRNLVVIGGCKSAEPLIRVLTSPAEVPWVTVLGVFDDRLSRTNILTNYCPFLGTFREIGEFSRTNRVDDIVIALPWHADARLDGVYDQLRHIPADIHLVPDTGAVWLERGRFVRYFGGMVLNVGSKPIDGWNSVVKWIEDKVVALLMIALLSPVLLLTALAVKLTSRGPILFRQHRLGFYNEPIEIYKFRTLYHEAQDADADRLVTQGDPRVTPIGRILRRYSIDELPQLFNVLKGTMSLVGPRPHAMSAKAAGRLYQEVVENYAERHKIKPGITGLAQVNGFRGETDTEDKIRRRIEYDIDYMENWSLGLDLKIMVKTLYVIFRSHAAY